MSKRRKVFLIAVAFAVLAAGWFWRYSALNARYEALSENTSVVYQSGEIVPFGEDSIQKGMCADGYFLRVDGFEIRDYESVAGEINLDQSDSGNHPEKIALVRITLFNENSNAEGVMLTELVFHGIDMYAGMNRELLPVLNEILDGSYGIHLPAGTECSLVLPYNLYQEAFGHSTWNSLEKYAFFLRITAYPTEKDIQVQ